MTVTLAKHAGFCPGVKRADKTISNAVDRRKEGEKLYTLGDIIHNETYVNSLRDKGVISVTLDEMKDILETEPTVKHTLFLRTHGITKEELFTLTEWKEKYPDFRFEDLTCPSVLKIHDIAANRTNENTVFLLFCNKEHPESRGILSFSSGEKYAFSSPEEIRTLDFHGKHIILASQTTENLQEYENIKNFLKKLYTNIEIFDTICNVTETRQKEAVHLASSSDVTVVVGSKNSSNSQKLFEVCKKNCPFAFFVSSAAELPPLTFSTEKNIGITAGASTPDGIITEVLKAMENNFATMLEESLTTLHTGETVTGTVYAVTPGEIFLDLGAKFTGVIAKEQITDEPGVKLADLFKVGDSVTAFVIRVEDGKGVATLSKKRVDADRSWVTLKDAFDAGTVLKGTVTAVVKGGVTMTIDGNRVFVPASQTGIAKDGDLAPLSGTEQEVRIIDFDETKKKAIASIKVIANEKKLAKENEAIAALSIGQRIHGVIKNLTPYGAFVDLGGIDGMIHNSELSWKHIKHPSQVVSVGQKVDVVIKDIDAEKRRISLGYKTEDMDNWKKFSEQYKVGDIVPAKIVAIMPFGAFGEVFEDVDGLIHISRISTQRVNSPADVLKIGDVVDTKIVEIDNENRKLALSIRAIMEEEEKKAAAEAYAAEKAARDAEREAEKKREEEERADMAPYIVGSI